MDGALGKIAIRTRAAPRKLLQVERSESSTSISEKASSAAPTLARLPSAHGQSNQQPSLSRWKVLVSIEKLYDVVLEMEQLRRMQPQLSAHAISTAPDAEESLKELEKTKARYEVLLAELWTLLRVGEPVDIRCEAPHMGLIYCTNI